MARLAGWMTRLVLVACLSQVALAAAPRATTSNCALIGPQFPKSAALHRTSTIQETANSFAELLSDALQNGKSPWGPLDRADTSFSVGIFSTGTNDFLFEHHHVGDHLRDTLTGGTLNRDTLYRIGSVTKLLTVYTILVKLGPSYWDEPVTKYIPELLTGPRTSDGSVVQHVNWEEVTLGALAGHLAGIARDNGFFDLSNVPGMSESGLPHLEKPVQCGSPTSTACSRQEALDMILQQLPVSSTFSSPTYCNEGFQLLGMAVERITGQTFEEMFDRALVKPLDLSRTFWTPPLRDGNAANVTVDDPVAGYGFNYDMGNYSPTGGVISSLGDLSSIGRSILRSSLLPPATTRQWMKPDTHTGMAYSAVGKPWEITRMQVPIQAGNHSFSSSSPSRKNANNDNKRLVDLYTKNGGIGAYESYLILSPDHDLGITIFTASNLTRSSGGLAGVTMKTLSEMTTSVWVTAAERAARQSAGENFAGVYEAEGGQGGARVELALVPGRQGLAVIEMAYNGTDIVELLGKALGVAGADLHYMGLSSGGHHRQVSFRAIWSQVISGDIGDDDDDDDGDVDGSAAGTDIWSKLHHDHKLPTRIINHPCASTWGAIDLFNYGNFGLDHFIFTTDEDGGAVSLRLPALRVTLIRKKKEGKEEGKDAVSQDPVHQGVHVQQHPM